MCYQYLYITSGMLVRLGGRGGGGELSTKAFIHIGEQDMAIFVIII